MTAVAPAISAAAAPAADHVVRCVGLTKYFRDFWLRNRVKAVDGVDLDIRRGEVFGLLGPNGSGKSTTIKLILGLLRPTEGKVFVFGRRPDDVAMKKDIGYLPEESYLYRFLTARETLDYYARLFHLPRHQRQSRIDMLLEMVGLEAVQRRPVGEFSKGMQRRIGLAQALINDPHLLILDEPTTGLDPLGSRQIKDLIVELSRRGKTILLCSHLLSDVEDVCHRVAIMFGGRVRQTGTVDQLLVQQNVTNIQTQPLDPAAIQELDTWMAERGRRILKVDHPRQKLETLFLDIVQQAQAEGLATAGAVSGGAIAGFLVDHAAGGDEAQQVIQGLLRTQPAPAAPAVPTTSPVGLASPAPATSPSHSEHEANEQVERLFIEQLTQAPREPQAAAPASAIPVVKPPPPPVSPPPPPPLAATSSQIRPMSPASGPGSGASGRVAPPAGDMFEQPPTEDELHLINSLVQSSWNTRENPVAPGSATPVAASASPEVVEPSPSPRTPSPRDASGGMLAGLMDQVPPETPDTPEAPASPGSPDAPATPPNPRSSAVSQAPLTSAPSPQAGGLLSPSLPPQTRPGAVIGPAATSPVASAGERGDASFLDALEHVKPYDPTTDGPDEEPPRST